MPMQPLTEPIEEQEVEIAERREGKWTGIDPSGDSGFMPYLAALLMILSIVFLILRILGLA